jgi:hypothetical protein
MHWPYGQLEIMAPRKINFDISRQAKESVYIEIMMRCTKMFSLIALTSAFAGGLALVSLTDTATAATAVPDLCVATGSKLPGSTGPGGCVYSDTNAPLLDLDVCWDGYTARLKGPLACPSRQIKYRAKYGEVINPLTSQVLGYAPLPDACEVVPCEPSDWESYDNEDGVACCSPVTGNCVEPNPNGTCPGGNEITWCKEKEIVNGAVICHE